MNREKILETILSLSLFLSVLFIFSQIKILLVIAVIIGMMGLSSILLGRWIAAAWIKVIEACGHVTSRVLLAVIYFIILVPTALLYRRFNKNMLQLKKMEKNQTYYFVRGHKYVALDFENLW